MKAHNAAKRHFDKNPYRYNVVSPDPNRAQRRAAARRDLRTGKLIVQPGKNLTYRKSAFSTGGEDHA